MKVHHRPVPTREAAKDFIGKMIDNAEVFTGAVWFVTGDDNQTVIAVTGTAERAAVNAQGILDGERWRAMRDAERNEYVKAAQMLAIDRAEFRVRAEKAEAERDALLADALRWRHIRDECAYSYGDGHTEPVEHGIHLDWMQGAWIRDESNGGIGRPDTFPGWNSLVDNLISNLATELTEDDAIDAAMKGVGG